MTERATGATEAQIEALEAHSEAKLAYVARSTGATDAQITAAHLRRIASRDWTETTQRAYDDVWMTEARANASYLVPPDHRILGPDDIAALRYAITELRSRGNLLYVSIDDVDRLAALIGDDK
jgi:hypothetical protein